MIFEDFPFNFPVEYVIISEMRGGVKLTKDFCRRSRVILDIQYIYIYIVKGNLVDQTRIYCQYILKGEVNCSVHFFS